MEEKIKNDWQGVNDDINFVDHKKNRFKGKKLLALLAALLLALGATGTGGYFVVETMIDALNFNGFRTADVDLVGADFRVNMAEVPIISTDENLRLNYFESTLKVKAFDYLSQLSWWKLLFSTNPDDFIFTWYQPKSDIKLGPLDVSRDGIDPCDLVITVKNSGYSFRIHVGSFIYNNAKFYENFMIFNRFETQYAQVDSDGHPIKNNIANKGYLSESYSVKNGEISASYNKKVYQWIENRIKIFSNNEEQEMVSENGNLPIYPILTSIPADQLEDINIQDLSTLTPYIPLITDPENNYFDENSSYETLNVFSKEFSIIYSPIPNLIEKIIAAKISDATGLDNFLKNNRLNFVPFVETNQAITASSGGVEKYTTPHDLIFRSDMNDKTTELTKYFYYASNTINLFDFKFNINSQLDTNIASLNIKLRRTIVRELLNQFNNLSDALWLKYPDPNDTPQGNFMKIKNDFETYFKKAFNTSNHWKIDYYDANNNILNLPDITSPIPFEKIKHFSISFGPNVVNLPSIYNAQSFSFFFKIFWDNLPKKGNNK